MKAVCMSRIDIVEILLAHGAISSINIPNHVRIIFHPRVHI
jgi:hypothetical protein